MSFFFALKLERWTAIVSISIHLYMLYDPKGVLHPIFFSRVIIAQKLGAVLVSYTQQIKNTYVSA